MEKLLPPQLRNPSFSFIPLDGKNPAINGIGWQKQIHRFGEAESWHGNYGVMTGHGGLVVIDADCEFAVDVISSELPTTFTVKTGGLGERKHFYFFCPEIKEKIIFGTGKDHKGELLSFGFQVVGPGSIHPDTQKQYMVSNDLPIVTVTREQIEKAIAPLLPIKKDAPSVTQSHQDDLSNLKITDFFPMEKSGVIKHPIHGAEGNGNLSIDIEKNLWHCFRCESGGNAVSLYSVLHGIVDCSEARHLRGDKFKETINKLRSEHLIHNITPSPYSSPGLGASVPLDAATQEHQIFDFLKYETLKSLTEKEFPPVVFVLDPYFESGTLNMVTAPPNVWKSWIVIDIALAMTKGEKWLGKYQAQKNSVWIINEEDSERNIASRCTILGHKGSDSPLLISAMKGFSAENPKMIKSLLARCKADGVGVVIFDTLRAIHHGNENDSAVMQIVMDNLKMLTREGITVIFNHHHKKSSKDEKAKVSDAEMQRGSSAISAAVSGHISLEEEQREDGTFIILKHLKSKVTEKDPPIQIFVNKKYREELDEKGKRIVGSMSFEIQGEYTGVVYAVEKAKEEVLKRLKDRPDRWISKKELNEICACGKSNLDKSLVILLDNKLMHKSTRKALGVNLAGKGAMNELFFTYRDTENERQMEAEFNEINF